MAKSRSEQLVSEHVTDEKGSYSQRLDVTMAHYLALIASLPDCEVPASQNSEAGPAQTTLSLWVR